jgi:hypothetical protein
MCCAVLSYDVENRGEERREGSLQVHGLPLHMFILGWTGQWKKGGMGGMSPPPTYYCCTAEPYTSCFSNIEGVVVVVAGPRRHLSDRLYLASEINYLVDDHDSTERVDGWYPSTRQIQLAGRVEYR